MSALLGAAERSGVFAVAEHANVPIDQRPAGKIGIFLYGTHPESVAEHANVPSASVRAQECPPSLGDFRPRHKKSRRSCDLRLLEKAFLKRGADQAPSQLL